MLIYQCANIKAHTITNHVSHQTGIWVNNKTLLLFLSHDHVFKLIGDSKFPKAVKCVLDCLSLYVSPMMF